MSNPHRRGVVLAVLAALAFGLATPFVARVGVGVGPFTTAACLYLGAALIGLGLRGWRRGTGRALRRSDGWRSLPGSGGPVRGCPARAEASNLGHARP